MGRRGGHLLDERRLFLHTAALRFLNNALYFLPTCRGMPTNNLPLVHFNKTMSTLTVHIIVTAKVKTLELS